MVFFISGFITFIKAVEDKFFFLVRGSAELSSSDRISIPIEYMPKSPTPKVGDIISIQYNGEIMESYPAQLGEIYDIRFIETDNFCGLFPLRAGFLGDGLEHEQIGR